MFCYYSVGRYGGVKRGCIIYSLYKSNPTQWPIGIYSGSGNNGIKKMTMKQPNEKIRVFCHPWESGIRRSQILVSVIHFCKIFFNVGIYIFFISFFMPGFWNADQRISRLRIRLFCCHVLVMCTLPMCKNPFEEIKIFQ